MIKLETSVVVLGENKEGGTDWLICGLVFQIGVFGLDEPLGGRTSSRSSPSWLSSLLSENVTVELDGLRQLVKN